MSADSEVGLRRLSSASPGWIAEVNGDAHNSCREPARPARGSFVMDVLLLVKYRQSIAVNLFLPLPGRAA